MLYKITNPLKEIGGEMSITIPGKYISKEPTPKIEIKCPRCGEMNTRKESVEDVD
ncbi:MAG TPA: hypothetical protein P5215_06245 [Bacteroidales bacterium]|nr:hypothetical protein [Bacteroidales bacterium]